MQFDIEGFYPSISKDLLLKAIDYTKGFVNITDGETKTIIYSRKSLLFSGTDVCIKKMVSRTLTSLWAPWMDQKFVKYLVFIFCIN